MTRTQIIRLVQGYGSDSVALEMLMAHGSDASIKQAAKNVQASYDALLAGIDKVAWYDEEEPEVKYDNPNPVMDDTDKINMLKQSMKNWGAWTKYMGRK